MKNNYYNRLDNICTAKNSHLCIGLDFDLDKMKNPNVKDLDSLESFIKDIIDSTIDICSVYKPNFAFYEKYGPNGMSLLKNIVSYINNKSIVIADAKRGDIGNTSKKYAQSIFDYYNFDAVTIAPYMGTDSIKPFIDYVEKGIYILCLTSNNILNISGLSNISKNILLLLLHNEPTSSSSFILQVNNGTCPKNVTLLPGFSDNSSIIFILTISLNVLIS